MMCDVLGEVPEPAMLRFQERRGSAEGHGKADLALSARGDARQQRRGQWIILLWES